MVYFLYQTSSLKYILQVCNIYNEHHSNGKYFITKSITNSLIECCHSRWLWSVTNIVRL